MATAARWVVGLALVDMRWISEEGVRCGREGAGNFAARGGVGDGGGGGGGGGVWDGDGRGGGVLGDVVEIARVVVMGWCVLDRKCNGSGRGVVARRRVADSNFLFSLGKGAGHEERCIGVG